MKDSWVRDGGCFDKLMVVMFGVFAAIALVRGDWHDFFTCLTISTLFSRVVGLSARAGGRRQ